MVILFAIIAVVTAVYTLYIIVLHDGIKAIDTYIPNAENPKTCFSILIPFRNEAENIVALLDSIAQQEYPKDFFEIIVINDASTDESVPLIKQFIQEQAELSIQLIENNRKTASPKKDALVTAIALAKYDWILSTDADCIATPQWLATLDGFIQEQQEPHMIVGPVMLVRTQEKVSFFDRIRLEFELLDILSLQAATLGAFGTGKPVLNNGANLAFTKFGFHTVNGYVGNDHLASGDDHFLLEKFVQWRPEKVHYLKARTAIITTYPEHSWAALFKQRKRWAAKTVAFKNRRAKALAAIIFIENLLLVIATISIVLYTFFIYYETYVLLSILCFWLFKIVVDRLLLRRMGNFLNIYIPLHRYLLSACIYPWFSVLIAIRALCGGYHWKGRHFKR